MNIDHFKQKFIEEADMLLSNLDNLLIHLEKNPSDIQYVNEVFRVIHTIKGTSGMYGFDKVVEITHEIENLYDMVRDRKLLVSQMLVNLSFATIDHIKELLIDEEFKNENNIARHAKLKESVNLTMEELGLVSEKIRNPVLLETKNYSISTWNILFFPNDELLRRCVNLIYTFQDLFVLGKYKIDKPLFNTEMNEFWSIFLVTQSSKEDIEGALMFIMDYCTITKIANFDIFDKGSLETKNLEIENCENQINEVVISELQPLTSKTSKIIDEPSQNLNGINENRSTTSGQNISTRINVATSKLDLLMYLVSELVTTKSELLIALQKQNEIKSLEAYEKIDKLSKLFSENALSIRLVSIQGMLSKFKRLIHDLSKQLNKNIDFIIVGEDTELDKSIVDSINEPIMHLLRNCIDHGIEIPSKRLANNKSEIGIIRFEAFKTGNYVYINISDDGNGIDSLKLLQKAIEKGIISSNANLCEKEIYDLIFLPGFSTTDSVTNVSGRGVGMDIVQKRINELHGEINIWSKMGVGTTFTLKFQQIISIINALLIVSGNITYAIPIEDIEICVLEAHKLYRHINFIEIDNTLIPFLNLHKLFAATSDLFITETEKIVIINKHKKRYAIVADSIIGECQAIIKPIGKAFHDARFLSGASLLGDGSIALLIDTEKLWYLISEN